MAFSSNFFLFAFLPIVLGIYFLCRPGYRNAALLGASLLFYAFDAGWLLWILLVSILLNHAVASTLVNLQGTTRRLVFAAAVIVNVAMLAHYKYTAFLWNAAAGALSLLDVKLPAAPSIALPIGISFFTFQAVSYIADVHTGVVKPARRLLDFAMYHSLFPQLIAGPIVRYSEIERSINRTPKHARRRGGRHLSLLHWSWKKADHRRYGRPDRRPDFQPAGVRIEPLRRLARRHQLHASDLLRFLGLQRHGDRSGKIFGFDFPGKFRPALPLAQRLPNSGGAGT